MKLISILNTETILCQHIGINRKLLLEQISILFTNKTNINKSIIFDELLKREKLGSTAIGHGVAIPHIRSPLFSKPQLAIIQLKKPIHFDAEDKRPVDIIFALIATHTDNSSHLNLLAECTGLLALPSFRDELRQAKTPKEIKDQIQKMVTPLERI